MNLEIIIELHRQRISVRAAVESSIPLVCFAAFRAIVQHIRWIPWR
jgi:hypothetical protein